MGSPLDLFCNVFFPPVFVCLPLACVLCARCVASDSGSIAYCFLPLLFSPVFILILSLERTECGIAIIYSTYKMYIVHVFVGWKINLQLINHKFSFKNDVMSA